MSARVPAVVRRLPHDQYGPGYFSLGISVSPTDADRERLHDVDNASKDVMDAMQGRIGSPGELSRRVGAPIAPRCARLLEGISP